jgi:hypothetical protein
VHRGKHKLEAVYTSRDPFFFTTPSNIEVEEDDTANFGIGYSLSGLTGKVLNDAGQGVADVAVTIESRGKKWSVTTEADGSFFVSSLVAGDYEVQADADSLPAGYVTDGFGEAQNVTVGAASPGKAAFTVRALRSISGRVLRYDTAATRYVPVNGARVILREPGLSTMTDTEGRYLFRDLAAGTYTISVQDQAQAPPRAVQLKSQPIDLTNLDFQIGEAATLDAPTPAAPVKPQPLALRAPALPEARSISAQQHNLLGRELTKAGRYRDATVELTEALRIAPDFALALNARGFARFMLHEWGPAIADLDRAIFLNPSYADAYHIRAIAKHAIGDAAGAASDSQRAQQLGR